MKYFILQFISEVQPYYNIFLYQHVPVNTLSLRLPEWVGVLPMQSALNPLKAFMPSGGGDDLYFDNVILTLLQLQKELQKIV